MSHRLYVVMSIANGHSQAYERHYGGIRSIIAYERRLLRRNSG